MQKVYAVSRIVFLGEMLKSGKCHRTESDRLIELRYSLDDVIWGLYGTYGFRQGRKYPRLYYHDGKKYEVRACTHARTNARNSDDRRHAGSTEVRRCLRVAWPSNLARVRAFFSLFCHLLKLETLTVLRQMSQTWPPRCHVKTKGEGRVGHTSCLKTV